MIAVEVTDGAVAGIWVHAQSVSAAVVNEARTEARNFMLFPSLDDFDFPL
jgi:hypothetical protein